MPDSDGFLDPSELISARTLARFEAGYAPDEEFAVADDISPDFWGAIDAGTRLSLENGARGYAEGAAPKLEGANEALCLRATRAGYWLARVMLGTERDAISWSTDAEAAANELEEVCGRMDILPLGVFIAGSIELIDRWCAERGLADDEEMLSRVGMCFDNGVATALFEHDRSTPA